MGDGDDSDTRDTEGDGVGTVADAELLDRIARRLDANERFSDVSARPEYAPDSVVADYDTGYYPADVSRAYLRVRWYENGDFSVQYTEQRGSNRWNCRWDRHPNPHNAHDHFHPPVRRGDAGRRPRLQRRLARRSRRGSPRT